MMFLILIFFIGTLHGQISGPPSYSCSKNNFNIEFSLSSASHSANNPLSGCALSPCSTNKMSNQTCRSSQTLCFIYQTSDQIRYCAPASLCSILESCNNYAGICSSNTSVCVINSCCSPKAICLPLLWTTLCPQPTTASPVTSSRAPQISTAPYYLAFAPMVRYVAGSQPQSMATGDFNSDNRTDLVVTNYDDNTISIFLASGNGTFKAQGMLPTDRGPSDVAVTDVNDDNRMDVIVANVVDQTIEIFLGSGNGSFSTQISYHVNNPNHIVVARLNFNASLDIVVSHASGKSINVYGYVYGNVSLLKTFLTGTKPAKMTLGDLNNDGQIDLLVCNTGNNSLTLLLGDVAHGFVSAAPIWTSFTPDAVAIGDMNGNNLQDVVVTGTDSNIYIFFDYRNGTFASNKSIPALLLPCAIALADLNGDQKTDIIVVNYYSSSLSIYLGYGNGSFTSPLLLSTASYPIALALGDFNYDGRLDIAVVNEGNSSIGIFMSTL